MDGAKARTLPPTYTWGVVGYISRTQRIVRCITADHGWTKNGMEAELVSVCVCVWRREGV